MSEIKEKNKNNNIALLGLGKDNLALLKLLDKHQTPVNVSICDKRDKSSLPAINLKHIKPSYQLGLSFNKDLHKFSILYRSPGWPLKCPGLRKAKELNKNIKISSAVNVFFDICPSENIIGISGTKGKGTTATLIAEILKKAYAGQAQVFLGGNIGISPLSFVEKIKKEDYVVLELSSFQLEDLAYSPKIAVLTNLFPEHLAPADPNNPNYHPSLASYFEAKLSIVKGKDNKFLIANESLRDRLEKSKVHKNIIYFSSSSLPTKLVGDYNKENIAASVEVAKLLKINPSIYKTVISEFANLEHRLELVATKNGVKYYDNSFSTTPESTILDLKSFSGKIIQLAGGADKGSSFTDLAKVVKDKTHTLILFPGEGSKKIKLALKKINFPIEKIINVSDMSQAVAEAAKVASPGDTVLLSTACASFGVFKNYKERGNLFKKHVKEIKTSKE